jgi:outer membrane protein TolC
MMKWARFKHLIAAAGASTALATGCHTPWEAPDSGVRTTPPVAVSVHAPAHPVRTVGAEVAHGARPVRTAAGEQTALPLPTTEETLDLGVALRLAGVSNPTINIAREQVREALAGQLAARALLLPTVNIGGNYHHHDGTLQASPGFIRTVDSQSLYLGFGARTLAAESVAFPGVRLFAHLGDAVYEPLAARQEVRVRGFEARAVENTVLLDVATEYLELIGAETRLAILHKGETELAELVRLTKANVEAGKIRPSDGKRSEANAELLRRLIRQGEEDVAVASARLCRVLSLDPSVRVRTPGGDVDPIRLIPEDTDTEALVARAVQARPEVFARSAAIVEAQTRRTQEKVRPWVPLVSVGYSGGWFGGGSNLVASNFGPLSGRSDFDVFAVWNVQNLGFGNRARVRQADAVYGQAVTGYDLAVNQIRREVVEAVADARAAARQIDIAKKAVANAEEGLKLEIDRIRGGFGQPLEALDNFRQLLEGRRELLRAVVAFNVAQFRLFVAVGSSPLP